MDPNIAERIRRNDAMAARLNIRGTPTFFANGRVIPGAIPWELFRQVIEELSR
jgi:protein-disulfide isomerase